MGLIGLVLLAGLCVPAEAAESRAGLTWSLSPFAEIVGDELVVDVPAEAPPAMYGATAVVDLTPYEGRSLSASVRVKADEISSASKSYYGTKFMFHFANALTGIDCWPEAMRVPTPFDWRTVEFGDTLSGGSRSPDGTLFLGLQGVTGRIVFDLSSLRIMSGESFYPKVNQELVCEYSEKVRNASQKRGVMLPAARCTEDDFRTLREWGATLGRYQMTNAPLVKDGESPDDYLPRYNRWLDERLDHLEFDVLPWAIRYGLEIVIDLHVPPGGRVKGGREFRMFREKAYAKAFIACWQRIAGRFVGRPGVYGYDLVNEPDQSSKAPFDYWTSQRMAAEAVRKIDAETPIVIESNCMDSPLAFSYLAPLDLKNVIYQLHMYEPGDYTHQGVHGQKDFTVLSYPTPERGKDFLIKVLSVVRRFELKHHAKIYVGEFSVSAWAQGADAYLADCIDIFKEYGWDWTYHAFREWEGWSVEHEAVSFGVTKDCFRPSADNPRKRALLKGIKGE